MMADVVVKRGWNVFTSNQMGDELGLDRKYAQKKFSDMKRNRVLECVKMPRRVRGGYNRGVFNLYQVSKRGWKKVEYWRRRNGMPAQQYLATATGHPSEISKAIRTEAVIRFSDTWRKGFRIGKDPWRVPTNDPQGVGVLFANLDPARARRYLVSDGLASFTGPRMADLNVASAWQDEGILPKSWDLPVIFSVAKVNGSTRQQTLISLLHRGAIDLRDRLWKEQFTEQSAGQVRECATCKDLAGVCSSLIRILGTEIDSKQALTNEKASLTLDVQSLMHRYERSQRAIQNVNHFLEELHETLGDFAEFPYLTPLVHFTRTHLQVVRAYNAGQLAS
jgi:hypothetical protein